MDGEAPREGRNKEGIQKQSKKNLIFLSYNFSLTMRPLKKACVLCFWVMITPATLRNHRSDR